MDDDLEKIIDETEALMEQIDKLLRNLESD